MEVQLTSIQKAKIQNESELAHARKVFRVRMVLCLVFAGLASAGTITGGSDAIWFAVPLSGIALIFLLLSLDTWGHCREVSGRRWTALTPRFSSRETNPPADQGSAQPVANAGPN